MKATLDIYKASHDRIVLKGTDDDGKPISIGFNDISARQIGKRLIELSKED